MRADEDPADIVDGAGRAEQWAVVDLEGRSAVSECQNCPDDSFYVMGNVETYTYSSQGNRLSSPKVVKNTVKYFTRRAATTGILREVPETLRAAPETLREASSRRRRRRKRPGVKTSRAAAKGAATSSSTVSCEASKPAQTVEKETGHAEPTTTKSPPRARTSTSTVPVIPGSNST